MQGCVLHVSAIAIPNGETQKGALGNRQSHTPWSNLIRYTVIGLDPRNSVVLRLNAWIVRGRS